MTRIRKYTGKTTKHLLVVKSWTKEWDGLGCTQYMLVDVPSRKVVLNFKIQDDGRRQSINQTKEVNNGG